jgi:hypothetical protein
MKAAWRCSLFATPLVSLFIACTVGDAGGQRSLSAAVWEFMKTLPDTVCRSCDTVFIHPLIVSGYEGPVRSYSGTGSTTPLPYPAGWQKQVAGKTLQITPLDQIEPRPGRVALAARLRGAAPDTINRGTLVIVEIYVAHDGRWVLEGAAVGVGSLTGDGWQFRLSELGWT